MAVKIGDKNYKVYLGSNEITNIMFGSNTIYSASNLASATVGSVIYSDKSFTLPDADIDTTKTPIGVVVFTAADTPFGDSYVRAMSIYAINSNGTANASSYGSIKWSNTSFDTPITNQSSYDSTYVEDGKVNTDILVTNYGSNCPAAYACSLYSTDGTSAGDWYLPSLYECKEGYGANKTAINTVLTNLGSVIPNFYVSVWTTTEKEATGKWTYRPYYNNYTYSSATVTNAAIPFLKIK